MGYDVFIPKFPTPDGQNIDNWREVFKKYIDKIDENTIFVGHSLGPLFILDVLQSIDIKIKVAFFVASVFDYIDIENFDKINKSFIENQLDWEKIRHNCSNFFLYHLDNDPYVSLIHSKNLSEKIFGNLKVVYGAGHFNKDFGYTKFDLLFDDIKKLV